MSAARRRGALPCLLLALVAALSAVSSGCGQMGPLTLPAKGADETTGAATDVGTGNAGSGASDEDNDDEDRRQSGR